MGAKNSFSAGKRKEGRGAKKKRASTAASGHPKKEEKDLLALFSRPGAEIASGAAAGKGPLELKVAEALSGNVGRSMVSLDSCARRMLGVKAGDVVELEGRRATAAVVQEAPRHEEGLGVMRMDGYLRQNAGAELGESVIVRRAKLENAKRIVLAPPEPTKFALDFEEYVKKRLVGRALAKGDTIYVRVFSTSFPLVVVAARPDGIALVTGKTELELREGPVVPANWLFEAAERLKNAKTASCGRCYGSAFGLKLLPARKTFWIETECRACKRKTSYILDFQQKEERLRISQLDKARIPFDFLDENEDIGYGTAHNTGEFVELLRKAPAESLEYHNKRGDFARWLSARDEDELAAGIGKAGGKGEALRQSLMFNLFYKTEKGEGAAWKKEKRKPAPKQGRKRVEKKKGVG